MIGKFACRICNKKKSKCFAFGITFTKLHGSKSCPDCGQIKQRGVFIVEGMWGDKMTHIGCLECNPVMDDDENIWSGDRVCQECFFEWKNDVKKSILLVTNESQDKEGNKKIKLIEEEEKRLENISEEKFRKTGKWSNSVKSEKPQTPQIQQEIRKRENYLQEALNSLAKINALNDGNPAGDTGNKSDNNFPTGLIIGGGIVLVLLVLIGIFWTKKQKK